MQLFASNYFFRFRIRNQEMILNDNMTKTPSPTTEAKAFVVEPMETDQNDEEQKKLQDWLVACEERLSSPLVVFLRPDMETKLAAEEVNGSDRLSFMLINKPFSGNEKQMRGFLSRKKIGDVEA